jgi:hypothetical protein|tara:strand:- start:1250 stop:1816 length:567 start_codon:yes stop_codon:yes gene_type:complete
MSGGTGFGWLFAAEAAATIGSKILDHNETARDSYYSHLQVNAQTALNNRLGYNALLGVNEEEQREYEKLALDKFELQKSMQRALATQLARDGSANKSGGSAESVANNIIRQGLNALHRKDFNYDTKLKNLQMQRNNIALQTASANNQALSGLKAIPSVTGLGLSIAGTAVQTKQRYESQTRGVTGGWI